MKILFLVTEYEGLVKTGGLADVARALPAALRQQGHEVKILMPCYRPLLRQHFPEAAHSVWLDISDGQHIGCSFRRTQDQGNDIYLLEHNDFYDRARFYDDGHAAYEDNGLRFAALSYSAFALCQKLNWAPDIIHMHDWHTALAGYYLNTVFRHHRLFLQTRTVLTIHNGEFQGYCNANWRADLGIHPEHFTEEQFCDHGKINLLRGGIYWADAVTAVSPGYRDELLQQSSSHGLWKILKRKLPHFHGIINGCDYSLWHPETDPNLPVNFSEKHLEGKDECKRSLQESCKLEQNRHMPLFGIVSRLTTQKGFEYLIPALQKTLKEGYQVVAMGTGDARFVSALNELVQQFPRQVRFISHYNDGIAHQIKAAADFFLMPSLFEPCGLSQIYSMAYGTIPIVRMTGGLRDTVEPLHPQMHNCDYATGIGFIGASVEECSHAIRSALHLYNDHGDTMHRMRLNGMRADFSWFESASQYNQLYHSMHAL